MFDERANHLPDTMSVKTSEPNDQRAPLVRYPGGKRRHLTSILAYLEPARHAKRFVEPFVGGGAVFFALTPNEAVLADLNRDLIDLYRGIRSDPKRVWRLYAAYESTREAYYCARSTMRGGLTLEQRAAQTLYLNRTCFRGMWRVNRSGNFNVGYGGEDRRWAITEADFCDVAKLLRNAQLKRSDFRPVIDICSAGDFIYADPPYSPGAREPRHDHYVFSQFTFRNHQRLARSLSNATDRGALWAVTTSSHPDIVGLFPNDHVYPLDRGTGRRPGSIASMPGEVIICNYRQGGDQ